jgi:hypothetical protein
MGILMFNLIEGAYFSPVREITDGKGTGFLVFIDCGTLAGSDPRSAEWVNGRGEVVRLGY